MGRKRGSRNAGAGTAAATAQGNAAAETAQEAVSTGQPAGAADTAGDEPAGDRPLAATGDQTDDAAGHELGDLQRADGGALDRPENDAAASLAADAVEGTQDAPDAAGAAGQEAAAQSQPAGTAQEETEGVAEAPLYRCHKQVRALKLTDITRNLDTGQVTLMPEDKSYEPFDAPPNWYERFHGSDNDTGYFVQYEDGFSSWSPTKAFEDGYSLMPAPDDWPIDAQASAGPVVEETTRLWTALERAADAAADASVDCFWGLRALDTDLVADARKNWREAGEFVLANRDAPATSIPIHLALQNLGGSRTPSPIEATVWSVFRAVFLLVHDHLDGEEKAVAAAKAEPSPSGVWPGERAMQPQPEAFAPTGFSPR